MNFFNFRQVKERLIATKRELLVLLGNQAQNYFYSSFRKQAFNGQPWKEVQRRIEGTPAYKYPKTKGLQRRTSPILVGAGYKVRGGKLRRAVSNMARTATFNVNGFRMIVDVDYAGYLNDGTPKMAARRFVGQTQELTEMQRKKIIQTINNIWKP